MALHRSVLSGTSQYKVLTRDRPSQGASLIGVKVLSDAGSGAYSDIIAGIDWVVTQAKSTNRPSVINCSLGGPQSDALNNAAKSAINSGGRYPVETGLAVTHTGPDFIHV